MQIRDIMTIYPVYIRIGADMRRAAEMISISEVSDLMVIDHDNTFIGVLSEGDLIRTILPGFDDAGLVEDLGLVRPPPVHGLPPHTGSLRDALHRHRRIPDLDQEVVNGVQHGGPCAFTTRPPTAASLNHGITINESPCLACATFAMHGDS